LAIHLRHAAAATALFIILVLGGCSTSAHVGDGPEALKPANERRMAPDFALKDADGRTVRLSDYRGKIVLLDFWATWCGPCKIEIPWFTELEKEYKDRGFAVLGVAMDEDGWDAIKPFLTELRVNYRTLLGNDMVAQQFGGVDALPTTFVIDREGRIASTHVGLASKSDYENDIQALLAQQ
jgi:peroxiredoxin